MSITKASARPSHVGLSKLLLTAAIAATVATAGCSNSKPESAAQAAAGQKADAAKIVDVGAQKMEKFLAYNQTEAIKNMLGGARGVFIAPYIHGEAALLGMENGTGYLMRRHGQNWSDPVFFKLSDYSLGYQGGAKEEHMMILLMTDHAVDDFVKGKMDIGGSGGFAIGTMGVGASGAGGLKGGLELIVVSTDEGAFVGGGMGTMTSSPATAINDDLYGPDANPAAILAKDGGKYAPADSVRATLSKWVTQAWGAAAP